jgi:predicted nucleic acid-binding protein
MERIIVDSDILIDFSRGDETAARWIEAAEESSTILISSVTEMELLLGSRDKRHLREIQEFLRRFQTLAINEQISYIASQLVEEYCLSHRLLVSDALIAATALANSVGLATINKKDFRFIHGMKLVHYP